LGAYEFRIRNHQMLDKQWVTFTVGRKGEHGVLEEGHVSTVDASVLAVQELLQVIQTESQYLFGRYKGQMAAVLQTKDKSLYATVFEFVSLVGLSLTQVYYVKSLLASKRVL